MQVRLINPVATQFRARLSFDDLEARSNDREKLAVPLKEEAREAARIRSENARKAGLANAKNRDEAVPPTQALLKLRAAKSRWKKIYTPRTSGIF